MNKKIAEIHVTGGKIYNTRMTLMELEEKLGEGFLKIHRGCIVSVMAIHDISDKVNLSNGESLSYTVRKRNQIISRFLSQQESMIRSFDSSDTPATADEYRRHYSVFDALPFAFTDIEMVFNEEKRAVDWIFRYANPALAKLEKNLWNNWWAVPLAACSVTWIPNGCALMSGQRSIKRCWRSLITVRRSTLI